MDTANSVDELDLVEISANIAAAYVSKNALSPADLPKLIHDVHAALVSLRSPQEEPQPEQKPAVPVRKSVTPDYIICLEDGKKFKSLRRHLKTSYDLSPQEYREKWGLPSDYPMVAPNYSAKRSQLAKQNQLGRKRQAAPPSAKKRKKASAAA